VDWILVWVAGLLLVERLLLELDLLRRLDLGRHRRVVCSSSSSLQCNMVHTAKKMSTCGYDKGDAIKMPVQGAVDRMVARGWMHNDLHWRHVGFYEDASATVKDLFYRPRQRGQDPAD